MKPLCLVLLLLIVCVPGWPQQAEIDELHKQLKTETIDTSRIHLLGDLARILIQHADSIEAKKLLEEGLELSKKQNYAYGFGHIYNGFGNYYAEISQNDLAEKYYQLAYDNFKKSTKDHAMLGAASALGNLGILAQAKGDIEKSIRLHLQGLDIWQASTVPERYTAVGNIYSNVASMYSKQGQFEKAVYYDKKGIEIRNKFGKRDSDMSVAYLFLADDFNKNKQQDSAKKYLAIAQTLVDELKTPALYMRFHAVSARIDFDAKTFDKSLEHSKQMLNFAKDVQNMTTEMNAHLLLAKNYQALNQPQKAISHLNEVIRISYTNRNINQRKNAMLELSNVYRQLNNPAQAYQYLTQYNTLKDSLNEEEGKLKLNEIDSKYQAAQKEKQILVLEQEKQRQNTLIYSLIAGLTAISLIGVLLYRNINIRKEIAEKEVKQLQQERQLIATNSILKGQEEERSRVARDLHDGLGGLLSGIKLTLNTMRGNIILPESGALAFGRALTQLDNAISEMRRVAHSMMPEALVKFGLTEALQDFCDGINESRQLKVSLQTFGLETPIESSTEVVLYRIVQELLNNIIKHAHATEAYVQITRDHNHLSLTVEDDGKGFDMTQLNQKKGAGMNNIETRVAYLNGKMDIQSQPNEGTSVHIEVEV
ncbi:tetratricopeptide repeat-containing sensor histidine kinase [Runella sp.]|uniref:tetratricopeptide repeat-containing sensor histidine kinase n=1 Tax=Runella sp. TaxID=1960881 RepID=UPI003D0F052C